MSQPLGLSFPICQREERVPLVLPGSVLGAEMEEDEGLGATWLPQRPPPQCLEFCHLSASPGGERCSLLFSSSPSAAGRTHMPLHPLSKPLLHKALRGVLGLGSERMPPRLRVRETWKRCGGSRCWVSLTRGMGKMLQRHPASASANKRAATSRWCVGHREQEPGAGAGDRPGCVGPE